MVENFFGGRMKLKSFYVTNYKSVLDSNLIEVDDITCLVGKNEAGKTAILRALYKLNPIRSEDAEFNVTDDYPRMDVSDYEDSIAQGEEHEQVVEATFELEKPEVSLVEAVFGDKFLRSNLLGRAKDYGNKRTYPSVPTVPKCAWTVGT
jgi:predicted ATP-dependent endonuclease of OLD family